MKLLKVLVNSLLSGLFFAGLLSLLFADLNINQAVTLRFLGTLTLNLAVVYGPLLVFVCFIGFFIIQFFSGRKARIAVVSPSFLCLSFSFLILVFLVFFRANYRYFFSFFEARLRALFLLQSVILLGLVVVGLAAFYASRHYRKKALYFSTYFVLFGLGLGFALAQRWRLPTPSSPTRSMPLLGKKVDKRITILGLDGLTFDLLVPLISEGKLPNFSWLMDNGSSGRLANFSPNEPVTLNASLKTGKFPAKHRQLSLSRYYVGKMKEPLEVVPRFMFFKQLVRTGFLEIAPFEPPLRVTDIWQILEANKVPLIKKDWPSATDIPEPGQRAEKLLSNTFGNADLLSDEYFGLAKTSFFQDCFDDERGTEEKARSQPQVYYLLLSGLNTVQAYFYKFAFPQQFGSLDQELIDRYGPVIEKYHNFYDQLLGKYITGLKEDELLVVFSPHGIEPLPVWKRFVERLQGNPNVSASHEFAPDGVVFFYGKGIMRGKNLEGLRIVDIAPTLLYYLGLPVARDMDGIVQSSLFVKEFIAENPIIYISSYEEFKIIPPD